MSKIGRNQPCPCGSEKKYKKCCLNKAITFSTISSNSKSSFEEFIKNNNSIALLKFFSLLQVLPQNHGKIVRLEDIQSAVVSNLNDIKSKIDLTILKKSIDDNFINDYREDPSESCFTENIMFSNGNNIVFTGINLNATEIIQNLIRVIFHIPNNFNENLKNEVYEGLLFMLFIHDEIARYLKYSRNMYEVRIEDSITFPSNEILKHSQLFEFSQAEVDDLCNRLQINKNAINNFLCDIKSIKDNQKQEVPLLCYKPFVKIDDNYFLAFPSSELFALNNFIIEKFKEYGEFDKLVNSFDYYSVFEFRKLFNGIGWIYIDDYELVENQSFWKFDVNKYAFVHYIESDKNSNQSSEIEKKTNDKINEIKNSISNDAEILMLFVYNQISMVEPQFIRTFEVKPAKYQTALSLIDFDRIVSIHKIDKLTFWKLFKAKARSREKGLSLFASPFHNIMTDFEWFYKQGESFLHSDEKYDFVNFSFDVQGNAIIKSIQKKDIHLVNCVDENGMKGFLPVLKTEDYAPIYLSEELYFGTYRLVLEKYNFPIWITFDNKYRKIGSSYAEAIAYWFNRIYNDLNPIINPNFYHPIEIIISFEENFINLSIEEFRKIESDPVVINYEIDHKTGKIKIIIPNTFFNLTNRDDNASEVYLIEVLIECLGNVLDRSGMGNISSDNIQKVLSAIPNDNTKMLLSATSETKIDLDERYIPKLRYLSQADSSIVLEDLVSWISEEVPEKIEGKEDKIKLCDKIISTLVKKIREELKNYNCFEILEYLMLRCESVLNFRAFRSIKVVTQLKCFGEYEDILDKFHEADTKAVRLSLAVRCLIEFVTSEPYFGKKRVNDDDTDFLLALMDELIYFGIIRDLVFLDMNNPEMGLLPSGRIGVSKEYFDNEMSRFNIDTRKDELGHYVKSFKSNYVTSKKQKQNSSDNEDTEYFDSIDSALLNDWKITLPNLVAILNSLAHYSIENGSSYMFMKETDFISLLKNEFEMSEIEIQSVFRLLILDSRGKFEKKVDGYEYSEILPWRYNRQLSYLSRPILRIKEEAEESHLICFSARHLYVSGQNLMSIFFDGTLKVDNNCSEIKNILRKIVTEKGDEFRIQVRDWIKENTDLFVLDYEFNITTKIADKNYGDVDVLALDEKRKILYCIECKNTKQAKIIYDFWKDIKNFTEKQLPKHINREKWLKNNLSVVSQRINRDVNDFEVKSIIISSSVLPVKFVKDYSEIAFSTLSQLVLDNIFSCK